MQRCDFSYLHYKQTLKEIKKTHRFSNFLDCSDHDIVLRHDVDISLNSALEIAKIENQLGIESTFFVLFHAELYNPFSKKSCAIIKEILKLGHNLGLHYNASFIIENGLDPSITMSKEIELMNHHYDTTIHAISAHDPSMNQTLSIKIPVGVVNANSSKYTIQRKYLSDSVQHWREGCFCKHFENNERLQVLIHPIWWTSNNKSRHEIMKALINENLDYKQEVQHLLKKYESYIQEMNKTT